MNECALILGSLFGGTAVIFGAFGAHALKKIMTQEQLSNYETGVKYQMYHAFVLLIIGFAPVQSIPKAAIICFTIGILLFSMSIYGLSISAALNKKLRFLGPITPIGGLFLVAGWFILLLSFINL